jgi:hypothetical protein
MVILSFFPGLHVAVYNRNELSTLLLWCVCIVAKNRPEVVGIVRASILLDFTESGRFKDTLY